MSAGDTARQFERVPPIDELRAATQSSKTKEDRRWTYRFFRFLSVYLTWAILHTRASANQVTVLSLLFAAAGLALVAFPDPITAAVGCSLLLGYHMLDRVDGEVARYRNVYSLLGVYLDNAGHFITGGVLFIGMAYRLAPLASDDQVIWLLGSLAAVGAILTRIGKHAPFQLFSQYVLEQPDLLATIDDSTGPLTRIAAKTDRAAHESPNPMSLLAVARNALLTVTAFPVVVLFFGLALIAETVTGSPTVTIGVFAAAAGLQIVGYLGVELANLSGNLGAESIRLGRIAGLVEDNPDSEKTSS